jgi:hypothetical protein
MLTKIICATTINIFRRIEMTMMWFIFSWFVSGFIFSLIARMSMGKMPILVYLAMTCLGYAGIIWFILSNVAPFIFNGITELLDKEV